MSGHYTYPEGFVHHLPVTGVWAAECHGCVGGIIDSRSQPRQFCTKRDALAWLRNHHEATVVVAAPSVETQHGEPIIVGQCGCGRTATLTDSHAARMWVRNHAKAG